MENRTNAIATQVQAVATQVTYTPEQIQLIKDTVAQGATDDELKLFLCRCQTYQFDPFLHEMWCVKMGGQMVITTSHDGYLKIANRDPNFDGLVGDVVYRGDNFRRVNGEIQHAYGNGHGDLKGVIGAYALVYKKILVSPCISTHR